MAIEKFESVRKAQERIDQILAEKEAELVSLADVIETDMRAISKADEALRTAESAGNSEKYIEAKKAKEEQNAILQMHEKRLNRFKYGALIDQEEYDQLTENILCEYREYSKSVGEKLMKYARKMDSLAKEIQEQADTVNATLGSLQHDCFRDQDAYDANGRRIRFYTNPMSVEPGPLVRLGRLAAASRDYRNYVFDLELEEKSQEEKK